MYVVYIELQIVGDCLENYDAWEKAGSNKGNAKNYKNCIYPPIISGNENTEIIDIIPPPELHLMIGIINIIFKHMLIEFEEDSLTWDKTCCVAQEMCIRDRQHTDVYGAHCFKKYTVSFLSSGVACSFGV